MTEEPQKKRNIFLKLLFPERSWKGFVRVAALVVIAFVFFKYCCKPVWIQGESMAPTYQNGTFNFCWRPTYAFGNPKNGDVVMIRYAGTNVMLLKRVVAQAGQTVEFRNGKLIIDDIELVEPYLKFPCKWNLPMREVAPGCVYVVGDNRDMPISGHTFGEVSRQRIMGGPVF